MNNHLKRIIDNTDIDFSFDLFQLLNANPETYSSSKDTNNAPTYYQPRSVRRLTPIMPKPTTMTTSTITTPARVKRKANIISPEIDSIALKRMRNTDAARRSRLKKAARMEQLETQVGDLEKEQSHLTTRLAVLETEKHALVSQDLENQARIRALEDQLAVVHKALTK